jgi:Cu+-exporting ATPase
MNVFKGVFIMSIFDLFKKKDFVYTVYINGMNCNHCANSIESAFGSLEKVSAKVDLHKKCAFVYSKTELTEDTIKQLVENTGFEFVKITK